MKQDQENKVNYKQISSHGLLVIVNTKNVTIASTVLPFYISVTRSSIVFYRRHTGCLYFLTSDLCFVSFFENPSKSVLVQTIEGYPEAVFHEILD